jgi:hypothetical protein
VQTLKKALELWAAEGSAEAPIMLTEDIVYPSYYDDITGTGLIDFRNSPLLASPRDGISSIILAGSGSGKTIDNGGSASRPVLHINNTGLTVTLKNLTVTGGRGNPGGGIYIGGGGKLIMESGVVVKDNEAAIQGGGVYVDGLNSTFTMKGGEIRNNKAVNTSAGRGGGVCVNSNGTFIMEGGTISNNESGNDGGGVYVYGAAGAIANACIRNGSIGVSGGSNNAKYGAGVYAGAYGRLELGTGAGAYSYPYIQYNQSGAGGTGGGIVVNGSGSEAIFRHGTVRHNDGAGLGGGILVVKGRLDMRGGTVTGNSAATGPGITVENEGEFFMSGPARVTDTANPVHLYGTGPKGWITIGTGGFTGMIIMPPIAVVTTETAYGPGDTILKQEESGSHHVQLYRSLFNVNGSYNLTSDGKLP